MVSWKFINDNYKNLEGYKRVAWPPVSEERIVREFTPQPVLPPSQQYYGQPVQQEHSQQKQQHQEQQPHHQQQHHQQQQPHHQQQQHQPTQHHHQQPQYRANSYDKYAQQQQQQQQPHAQQLPYYQNQQQAYFQPNQDQPTWARYQQPIQLHPSQQPYLTQHQQKFDRHQQPHLQQPQANQYNSYSQPQQHQQPQEHQQQQQYSQDQPDFQQFHQLQRGTSPGMISLRQEAPINQKPAPVFNSQPAAVSYQGGSNMRGDLKWPPQEYKEAAAKENAERRAIAAGPVCRPRKVHRDYTSFFAKNALSHHYPSYKVPPGTQHTNG